VGARPGPRRGGRTAGTGRWRGWRAPGRTPRRRDDEQRREAVHVQTVRVQIVGRGPARQPLVRDPLQRSPFSERDRPDRRRRRKVHSQRRDSRGKRLPDSTGEFIHQS
jgi:hypothetical protein